MRRRRLSLAAQILLLQLVIIVVTVAAAAAVTVNQTRRQLDTQYGQRVLAIAESVAALPTIREAFDDAHPEDTIQPIAEAIRQSAGADFVVVANTDQIRYSHPDEEKIGKPLSTDAGPALAGDVYIGTQEGTLGTSVRAKVPVRDEAGQIIGVVSVGILEERVSQALWAQLPGLLTYVGLALLLGAAGSVLLARRVTRQTFGLEPREIAGLLEQREATLHGIREGIVAVDAANRVTLLNDEATRLLGLPPDAVGRRTDDLPLSPRLRDVLEGRDPGEDLVVLREDRVLVLNRMPVTVRGEDIGAVVTLRDRTELEELARELDGARSTTDALRAQAHEFSNRMHTVAGLLELGEHEEAMRFVTRVTRAGEALAATVTEQVGDSAVAALLVAKTATAAEHGAELRIDPRTSLPADTGVPAEGLVTVVGNLVDNAVEALAGEPGTVEVLLRATARDVIVEVRDSGPGVAPELVAEVFREGFTTKVSQTGGARGLGLALTRQTCRARGGDVTVHNDGGAVFTATLPRRSVVPAPSRVRQGTEVAR